MDNTVNMLICILALLVGILIGQRYKRWKEDRERRDQEEESKKKKK